MCFSFKYALKNEKEIVVRYDVKSTNFRLKLYFYNKNKNVLDLSYSIDFGVKEFVCE